MSSVSKLIDFGILDCSNLFFQIPGLPGGLEFAQNPKLFSSEFGSEKGLTPGQLRRVGESETK
jgi:hypothetical protein